jgi:hypothetical protein
MTGSSNIDLDSRELHLAIHAFVSSGANPAGNLTERVSRRFGAAYLRQMSKSLTLMEVSAVLSAERVREAGLAEARAGDLVKASRLVAEARVTTVAANLSGEALWAAETFQLAAESYLNYRRRLYAEAAAELHGAIAVSIRLGSECGYRMDYRILHLARNLVHTESVLGSKRIAVGQALRLGAFISGRATAWPFAQHQVEHLPVLDCDERTLAHDDTIGEIALASEGDHGPTIDLPEADLSDMDIFLQDWLRAIKAYWRGEPSLFLRLARASCSNLDVTMPQIQRVIRTYLSGLCTRLHRDDLGEVLRRAA